MSRSVQQPYPPRQQPAPVVFKEAWELDWQAVGTVVRDAVKDPWQKQEDGKWGFPAGQATVVVNSEILARAWGPVTLVEGAL